MLKKIKKIAGIIVIIGLLTYGITCAYIESHKEELIVKFEEAFAAHCNGAIHFSNISLSSWTKFPSVFFEIEDLEFKSFNVEKHKEETIKAKDAKIKLSIAKIIRKKIQVKSIIIKDAEVELITNVGLPNTSEKKEKADDSGKGKKPLPLEKRTSLLVENLQLSIINHQKSKKFKFSINEINSNLNIDETNISGSVTINTIVSDLAFNEKNGSFFNGAQISGTLKPTVDLENKKVHIPTFDLNIDEQLFKVSSEITLTGFGDFLFTLENEKTDFTKSVGLVSQNIQKKLDDYRIEQPLYTHTTLEGSFAPKSNPVVTIKFNTENNSTIIKNKVPLDKVAFSGRFINRAYDDERAKTENKKNVRLFIDSFNGQYKGLDFQLKDAFLSSTPEARTAVDVTLTSTGNPRQLNNVLGSDTFFFENGNFDIKAKLKGDATYIDSLLNNSTLSLEMRNSSIVNPKNDLHIPIKNLSLSLKDDNAFLNTFLIELPSKDQINISGEIDNLTTIITSDGTDKMSSNLKIESKKVVWEDFLTIIQATKNDKKVKKHPKHTLQETLKDIYGKFNPSLEINIDELTYKSLEMKNFKSGLHYRNQNNLYLENTSFNFGSGTVALSGHLDLAQSEKVKINATVEAKGATNNLNAIFNNKDFLFEKGYFDLNALVAGDLDHIDTLIAEANSTLQVKDASVFFKPKELTIPIEILDIDIKDNAATLNKLQIGLASGDKIDFTGKLNNIGALLNTDSPGNVSSQLKIHSEKLVWEDFTTLFHKDKDATLKKSKKALKETLGNLYTSFNPSIQVSIEHFEYNNTINVQEFKTEISFENINTLKLEKTSFIYDEKGIVNLSATVNTSDPKMTFIDAFIDAQGTPEQLNTVFNNEHFIFKGGTLSLETAIKGDINQIDNLIANATSVLKLDNTSILFKESLIPIPELEIDILKNDALLKTLKIEFDSGDQIDLSGEIDNLTSLLFHEENAPRVQSELHIHSEKLIFKDFTNLFTSSHKEGGAKKKSKNNLKTTIHHIHNQFNPKLTVAIDQFKYHNLEVENLKTNIHFETSNKIYLENTGFDYYKGNVNLNAHLDIKDPEETLFALEFVTDRLDLEKLLASFDYFGMETLSQADRVGGEITLEAFLEGDVHDADGLKSNTLSGQIAFDLEDIEIKNFSPITKITNKIFKKERFEDIRFAPIKDVLYISNNTVEIPQFEIQSTAFDLFIEGHLGLEDKGTNIWTSIPLANLKHRDVVDIPDKKGYIDAGKKIFIEVASEKDGKAKYKLHLTNKKLYEQKHILGQYKKKHKEELHLRRKHRREARTKQKQTE